MGRVAWQASLLGAAGMGNGPASWVKKEILSWSASVSSVPRHSCCCPLLPSLLRFFVSQCSSALLKYGSQGLRWEGRSIDTCVQMTCFILCGCYLHELLSVFISKFSSAYCITCFLRG